MQFRTVEIFTFTLNNIIIYSCGNIVTFIHTLIKLMLNLSKHSSQPRLPLTNKLTTAYSYVHNSRNATPLMLILLEPKSQKMLQWVALKEIRDLTALLVTHLLRACSVCCKNIFLISILDWFSSKTSILRLFFFLFTQYVLFYCCSACRAMRVAF